MSQQINIGLEGIVVGSTSISHVQGSTGNLSYRGVSINEVTQMSYYAAVWLLLTGNKPNLQQQTQLGQFMLDHAPLNSTEHKLLALLDRQLHPMLMLQAMIPALSLSSEQALPTGLDTILKPGLIIAAKLPRLVAQFINLRRQRDTVSGIHELDPLRSFLRMINHQDPSNRQLDIFKTTQLLQLEHSYNAGTFAGRVTASTQAPLVSVIASSIATLYGPLHGGADQAALAMARTVNGPEHVSKVIGGMLGKGQKIMGMGHREYKTLDPRAAILKPLAAQLSKNTPHQKDYLTLAAIEQFCQQEMAKKGKLIYANVEFYKGLVMSSLGVPDDCFTALFAMARVFGYLAHYQEFQADARIIRPSCRYVGR